MVRVLSICQTLQLGPFMFLCFATFPPYASAHPVLARSEWHDLQRLSLTDPFQRRLSGNTFRPHPSSSTNESLRTAERPRLHFLLLHTQAVSDARNQSAIRIRTTIILYCATRSNKPQNKTNDRNGKPRIRKPSRPEPRNPEKPKTSNHLL